MCHVINFLLMLSQAFYVIIDRGVSVPGHGIDMVDGLNPTAKLLFYN